MLPAHRLEQGGVEEGAQLGDGSSHVVLPSSGLIVSASRALVAAQGLRALLVVVDDRLG